MSKKRMPTSNGVPGVADLADTGVAVIVPEPDQTVTPVFMDLQLPSLSFRRVVLRVHGMSPLITHKWSDKALRMIEEKQSGAARQKKEPRDPEQEFRDAIYLLPDGSHGVPAAAFKKAVVGAATHVDGITKTFLRTSFHVLGDAVVPIGGKDGELRPTDLIRLQGSEPVMRTDMVRIGGISKTADVRYRPEYASWWCDVTVRLNSRSITLPQLVYLFNLAGFGYGLCEWRPEKDGMHGMFQVTHVTDLGEEELVIGGLEGIS